MLTHEKRILATTIDVSIVLVFSLIVNIFVPNNMFSNDFSFAVIYLFSGFLYMFLSLIISKDKTIGLYSMSLKMLSRDWKKPTMKNIILRSLTNGVPVLYLVNILYMLLNKSETTFFDELTDSFIVKTGDAYSVMKHENIQENNKE